MSALRRDRVALVSVTRSQDGARLREVWQRLPPDGRQRSRRPELFPFGGRGRFLTSVAEKARPSESFAAAAARGLEEELGLGGREAAEALKEAAGGGEEEEASSSSASSSSSSPSYPNLPCRYETKRFAAEIDGNLLPSKEFFEKEEATERGTLVTRWQWVSGG